MGEVVSGKAKSEIIAGDIGTSYQNGMARGGDIADACKNRLELSVQTIESAEVERTAAEKAQSLAWAGVLSVDVTADAVIGATRDEMWNAVGRSRQSAPMNLVYPGGIGTYTGVDPLRQPVMMQLLHKRILTTSAPQWPEAKRVAWAANIEAAREPYHAAVEAFRPLEAAALIAEAGYRAAVRAGHARLGAFKRDLKNLGLTEAQIHEIIPDRS